MEQIWPGVASRRGLFFFFFFFFFGVYLGLFALLVSFSSLSSVCLEAVCSGLGDSGFVISLRELCK